MITNVVIYVVIFFHVLAQCNNITKLLTRLTQIDQEFIWDEPQKHAFQKLKTIFSSNPILRQPIQGRPFQLHTNQNTLGLRVVLTQFDDDGWEFAVAYANQSNNKTEAKYNSYEGECFVVIQAIFSFQFIFMVAHSFWLQTTDL